MRQVNHGQYAGTARFSCHLTFLFLSLAVVSFTQAETIPVNLLDENNLDSLGGSTAIFTSDEFRPGGLQMRMAIDSVVDHQSVVGTGTVNPVAKVHTVLQSQVLKTSNEGSDSETSETVVYTSTAEQSTTSNQPTSNEPVKKRFCSSLRCKILVGVGIVGVVYAYSAVDAVNDIIDDIFD